MKTQNFPLSRALNHCEMGISHQNFILTIYGHVYLPTIDDQAISCLRNYRCQRLALNFLEHQTFGIFYRSLLPNLTKLYNTCPYMAATVVFGNKMCKTCIVNPNESEPLCSFNTSNMRNIGNVFMW